MKMNYKRLIGIGNLDSLESWGIFYKQLSKFENRKIKRVKWNKKKKEAEK